MTIYTIAYNEEYMLPFFLRHYIACFHDCKIVVYDNESTDRTREIAEEAGCDVRTFQTGNKLSDKTYLEIKNHAWKETKGWVLVADIDEHIYIDRASLLEQERQGVTIIKGEGYNMISDDDNKMYQPFDIIKGVRAPSYDKLYCFDARAISDINYFWGCHTANPIGRIKYNTQSFKCRHYKYLNLPYTIKRHAHYASRMSEHNKKLGLGFHYTYSPEIITKEFEDTRKQAYVI